MPKGSPVLCYCRSYNVNPFYGRVGYVQSTLHSLSRHKKDRVRPHRGGQVSWNSPEICLLQGDYTDALRFSDIRSCLLAVWAAGCSGTQRDTCGEEDGINSTEKKIKRSNSGGCKGKLYVVGIGPGAVDDRTKRAEAAILQSDVIVGYSRYLSLISDLTRGKVLVSSGMTREVQRCREAIRLASEGQTVSLVSSGDPGVYGMAGLTLQLVAQEGLELDVEIVPGVTAALSAGAKLGAPLMLDFCVISLSDLLAPWSVIQARLTAAAKADMVTALYNPRSKNRVKQLEEAAEIFRRFRDGGTPVGIVTSSGTDNETIVISDLDNFLGHEIGMLSVVIIGSSTSTIANGRFITPRGYRI